LVLEQRTEASESEQSEKASNIPSVAAASQFGIESASSFKPRGFTKKNSADSNGTPTAQSDVDIALARANAAAAGEQSPAGAEATDGEDSGSDKSAAQGSSASTGAAQVSLRSQINHLRQASAAGVTDGTGN